MSGRFDDLTIKLSPLNTVIYLSQRAAGKIIHHVPGLRKLMRYASVGFGALESFGGTEGNIQNGIRQRQRSDGDKALDFASGFGYENEMKELAVADYYRAQIESGELDRKRSESGVLYQHVFKLMPDLFKRDSEIREVLDFGVSYGYVDSVLARQFPQIRFHGIDRSRYTKEYNEQFFKDIENLKFHAGDVFEFFKMPRAGKSVLFHMRTAVVLPESFLYTFYRAAHERSFDYIVGIEQVGISRETGRAYTFTEDDKPSVLFRASMFIHNYPGILKKCGYDIIQTEMIKTAHITPDFRLLSFVAKRV